MDGKISKTKALHVRQQEEVSETTQNEARAKCKFACPHPGCNHVFLTKRGMTIHAGKCQWKNEFAIEEILNHRGPVTARQYLVRWQGYNAQHNSWIPKSSLDPEAIKDYEVQTGAYVRNWQFRCPECDLSCKSQCNVVSKSTKVGPINRKSHECDIYIMNACTEA